MNIPKRKPAAVDRGMYSLSMRLRALGSLSSTGMGERAVAAEIHSRRNMAGMRLVVVER